MWNSVGVALISSSGFSVTIFSVYFFSILQTLTWQKQINQRQEIRRNLLKDHAPVMKTNFRRCLSKPPSQSFFLLLIAMGPPPT